MNVFTALSTWATDAHYAVRTVRKSPRLFVFAALIAGLGIGACTAVYSVLSPLMLRQLPFEEPDRLVWIAKDGSGEGMSAVTSRTSNLRDFRALTRSFEGLTGYFAFFEQGSSNLVGEGAAERLVGVGVAQNFLDVLGIEPTYGRNFVDEEGVWGGRPAILLSHDFWLRRFGGAPEVVGTSVTLDNVPTEIVGVLPATFDFASTFAPHTRVDFLQPFPISDETDRWGNTISIIGRLRPDATIESAQADLDLVIAGLQAADPERWGLKAEITGTLQQQIAGPFRSAFLLLAASAGAVMLIVCVNLSSLLLASSGRRAEEMAVRSALGASRRRLIRQLLFESLIVSVAGAGLGLLLAGAVTRFVASLSELEIPLLRAVEVDGSALFFTSGLALMVGILVGVVPAFHVTNREATVFREAGRGLSAGRGSIRLREGLVVAEVAIACILLVFGGLLLKSFRNVLDVELGYQPDQLVAWQLSATRSFEALADANAYYERLVESVKAVPGVEQVGLTDARPLGRNRTWGVRTPGADYDGEPALAAFPHVVDHRYLEVMKIPLLEGRQLTAEDTLDRPGVVILNESAARALFKGEKALGQMIQSGNRREVDHGLVQGGRQDAALGGNRSGDRDLRLDPGLEIHRIVALQRATHRSVDLSEYGLDTPGGVDVRWLLAGLARFEDRHRFSSEGTIAGRFVSLDRLAIDQPSS